MSVVSGLVQAMNAATIRQNVLSNNVSNAETPYFRRSDLRFDRVLGETMGGSESQFVGRKTDGRHLDIGPDATQNRQPYSVVREGDSMNLNAQSNVDIDYEMTAIAENALWYQALVQQTNHHLTQYRRVIEGR